MLHKKEQKLLDQVEHHKARLAKMPSFVRNEIYRLECEIARLNGLLHANPDSNVVISGWDGRENKPRITGLPRDSTIRFVLDAKRDRHIDVGHASKNIDRSATEPTLITVRGSHGQLVVLPNASNTISLKLGDYE